LLELLLYQKAKPKNEVICPICNISRCGKHCNNCQAVIGESIEWKEIEPKVWRLYDRGTNKKHYCHKNGTKSGKFIQNGNYYKCQWCKSEDKNHECYYDQIVIWESDNALVKQIKMKRQYKLKHRDDFVYRPADPKWLSFSFGMKG